MDTSHGFLSCITVRASDLRSSGRGFDSPSRSGLYQATQVNSAFHPSRVGKSSTVADWGGDMSACCTVGPIVC